MTNVSTVEDVQKNVRRRLFVKWKKEKKSSPADVAGYPKLLYLCFGGRSLLSARKEMEI